MKFTAALVAAYAAAALATPRGPHSHHSHRLSRRQSPPPPVTRSPQIPASPQTPASPVSPSTQQPASPRSPPPATKPPTGKGSADKPTVKDPAIKSGSAAAAGGCSGPVTLDPAANPFAKLKLHANKFYRAEVEAAAGNMTDATLKAAAAKVADAPTFLWIDSIANIAKVEPAIADTPCEEILGLVIYDLPGRDCFAKASNGELGPTEIDKYKTEYIDPIVKIIKAHANTAIALIIEPDSLGNLVTNIKDPRCKAAEAAYKEGVAYAFKSFDLPNVMQYTDLAHAGWLGWQDNQVPAAKLLAEVYGAAGKPKQFRGFASNVAGWNSFDVAGEFSKDADAKYNPAQSEKMYVEQMAAQLQKVGVPNHAIVDTGRNAVQGLRKAWGDWCNVKGAGMGPRFTTETGSEQCDAFVWGKPPGESDGTSDTSSKRFDSFCGNQDAFQPSPEAGEWNQKYFEELVKNAKPPFV